MKQSNPNDSSRGMPDLESIYCYKHSLVNVQDEQEDTCQYSSTLPTPPKKQKQQNNLPNDSNLTHDVENEENEEGKDAQHIHQVQMGKYLMQTWYVAPYPEEYSRVDTLHVCGYCMKYMKTGYVAKRHQIKCRTRHPPGMEIYRDGLLSVFEVNGGTQKSYCQNICLLAKMFLDHKTLYFDVEPFLFYVLCESTERGFQFLGYFSKEKKSVKGYNLSCIMTLPCYQRHGYGQFLIDFSYLLSKREGILGSPEKPLSTLGLLSYRKYWRVAIQGYLKNCKEQTSIEDISNKTFITAEDIISTLVHYNMLKKNKENHQYEIINHPENYKEPKLIIKEHLLVWPFNSNISSQEGNKKKKKFFSNHLK
ncbi:unnamed protein product [Rhizopus stolonifer]